MKKKARGHARCAMCRKKATYVLGDSQVCEECLRELVFMHAPEPAEVVSAFERVARLGELHVRAGVLALRRSAVSGQELVEAVTKGAAAFVPSDHRDVRPDAIIADDLLDEMSDRHYGINNWWIGLDTAAVAQALRVTEAESVRDLLAAAETDKTVCDLLDSSIRFPLFGETVTYSDVVTGDFGERLAAVSAAAFALGFARMVELGDAVQLGQPVQETYGAEERELFLSLSPAAMRRAEAGWSDTKYFLETLTERVDRRERLAEMWLLHPVSGRLAKYLTILHGLHVDGHHAAAVAFCRSLVESGVDLATDPAFLARWPTMKEKLDALEARRILTKDGRRSISDVWSRGSKVLHNDPALLTDSLATIRVAIQVLSELSAHLPSAPLDPAVAALLAELDDELQ